MSDDQATLKDVTVSSSQESAEPAKEAQAAEEKPIVVIDPAEAEAVEIGKLLLNSGYSKAQINDLLQAPQALNTIRSLMDTDPKQFVKQYALSNPDGASKLRDAVAEEYVELYGDKGGKKQADNGKGTDTQLMGEVQALRDRLNTFETQENRRQQAAALAATQQRYNSRVDDMLGQDGIKNLGLNKSETRALRSRLNEELAADQTIVQRVSNGNFVDVAPAFKRIVEEWAADKKASVEAEKKQRDNVQAGASFTFPGGPAELNVPSSASESWDATEEAFAKALQNAR